MKTIALLSLALILPLHAGNHKQTHAAKQRPSRQEIFQKWDKDHDGFLSKDEFRPKAKRPAKAAKAFAKKDTNSDGKLSLDEFTAQKQKATKHKKHDGGKTKASKTKHGKRKQQDA